MYADDRTVIAQKDTTIQLPINIDFYIKKSNSLTDKFFSRLREASYKHRWTKELHNVVVVPDDRKKKGDTLTTQKSEVPFLPYKNLIIRNISYQKLDVFGPTIEEPDLKPRTQLGAFANQTHVKTSDWVIKNHLLFKKGQPIDPSTMADNERLLRELAFIEDARIRVVNLSPFGDSADIIVVIKDNFAKGLDVTSKDLKSVYVDLWDKNILGSGQEFDNNFYNNPGNMPQQDISGYYKVQNIAGSYINSQIGYSAYGNKGYNINVWRDFYTQKTIYAGGISFQNMQGYTLLEDSSDNYVYRKLLGNVWNAWIGRAFPVQHLFMSTTSRNNIILSGGIFQWDYTKRPYVAKDFRYQYQNKTFYLLNLSFSSQGYYRSSLVYNYGRTEDIPYGMLIKLTHGVESNEFEKRLYYGASITGGNFVDGIGYLSGSAAFGGFMSEESESMNQEVLKLNSNYFSNLIIFGKFRFRSFINIGFTEGFHRNPDEFITINDLSGIRGFQSDSVHGTQRLVINLESVCFTPYYFAGFRFAIFGFADFGWIGDSKKSILNYPLYSGFGIGFRLRNEKLVFKTFQIRLAYYPWLPQQAQGDFFSVSEESKFNPENFNVKSPEIINFQ